MRNQTYFEDHKVGELVKFSMRQIDSRIISSFRPEHKIESVYDSYADAVDRIQNLAKYTPWLISYSLSYGLRLAKAVHDETGHFEYTRSAKRKEENIRLQMMEVEDTSEVGSLRKLTNHISKVTRQVLERTDSRLTDGLTAILPSMIVLAWTAFETMCEDVLETSIDLRPRWLSPLKGRRRLRKTAPWETSIRGKAHQESRESAGPGRRDRLSYRTIKGIRDAYYLAFFVDSKEIDRALRPRNLDTLFALRNIIVHKSGRVDQIFLNRVVGLPDFPNAKTNHPLQLDFGMVKKYIEPVLVGGVKLIVAVNKWVVEHPDAKAPP